MRKLVERLSSFVIGIFLLLFLWLAYLLFSVFYVQSNTTSPYTVPENAEMLIEVNGNDVFQDVLFEVLIKGNGDEVVEELKSISRKGSDRKQYGVNWTKPVSYFRAKYNEQSIQGLIVQIVSPSEWNKNINTLLGNTSVAKRNGNFGIVVQSDKLTKEELYKFLDQQKSVKPKKEQRPEQKSLLSVVQKSEKGTVQLSVSVEENKITSKGILDHDGSLKSGKLNFLLIPSDLHLTSDLITQELNDSLKKMIASDVFEQMKLSGISANYRGVTISEIEGQYIPIPNGDFILGFEKNITVQEFISGIPNTIWGEDNKSVSLGQQIYFVRQLDERTIFFGIKEQAEIKQNNQPIGLIISGTLKPLTNIKGNPLIRTALRMSPTISVGFELAEEIELCTVRIEALNKTSFELTSSFQFHPESNAVLKLLEILLKRQ